MNAGSNFEFSRPQTSVLTTAADRTLHMAGQRGGKTALMGPLAYSFVSYLPKSVGLIAANTYAQLSNSTLKEIFKVCSMVLLGDFIAYSSMQIALSLTSPGIICQTCNVM